VPLNVIQRQPGHTNLGVTSIYLQGIDNAEIIATVHARRAPMIPPVPDCASRPSHGRRCRRSHRYWSRRKAELLTFALANRPMCA
jgi:hypothetical protein